MNALRFPGAPLTGIDFDICAGLYYREGQEPGRDIPYVRCASQGVQPIKTREADYQDRMLMYLARTSAWAGWPYIAVTGECERFHVATVTYAQSDDRGISWVRVRLGQENKQ